MANSYSNICQTLGAAGEPKKTLSTTERKVLIAYLREAFKPFKVSNFTKGMQVKIELGSTNPHTASDDTVTLALINMNLYCTRPDAFGNDVLMKDETGLPFSTNVADPKCAEKMFEFVKVYILDILKERLKIFSGWIDITRDDIERLET